MTQGAKARASIERLVEQVLAEPKHSEPLQTPQEAYEAGLRDGALVALGGVLAYLDGASDEEAHQAAMEMSER